MIQFTREGTKVKIRISSNTLGYHFDFDHQCNTEYFAYMMKDSYQERMKQELERIKQQAYNEGWRDAKSKTKKRTIFDGWW